MLREIALAVTLTLAAALVVAGVCMWSVAAGLVVGGFLLAGIALLVLAEVA